MSTINGTVKSVIICDDVRIENNGKAILIGIYTGTISLQSFPSTLRLAFWLLGEVHGEGKIDFSVKVSFKPKDAEQQAFEANISPIEILVTDPYAELKQDFQLALPGIGVTFQQPGTLTVDVKQPRQSEYQTIAQKLVIRSEDTSSEPQQQQPS